MGKQTIGEKTYLYIYIYTSASPCGGIGMHLENTYALNGGTGINI